ncbi:MAG: hypothetical protein EBS10_07305 [Acidimicrobiia bacterium]|nr:hypothetical protein [Acidimicrobiia bacterium]
MGSSPTARTSHPSATMTFIKGEADMYDEPESDHDEGDTCPYCGDGPLHVHEGYLQCPNCGSSID